MDNDILIPILITSLIWILIAVAVYIFVSKKSQKVFLESNEKLKAATDHFNNKLEEILRETNEELRTSYEKGYLDAQDKKGFSVQIMPWTEEIDSSSFFKNKKSVKIGYKYQLFSQGLPCLQPHTIVVEELTVDKLNEENIDRAFTNLELAMNNIPNTGNMVVKLLGNGRELAGGLLKLVKKNK